MNLIAIVGLLPFSLFEMGGPLFCLHVVFGVLAVAHVPKILQFANRDKGFRTQKGAIVLVLMNSPLALLSKNYTVMLSIAFATSIVSYVILWRGTLPNSR